jgi:hypothetical protein
MGYVQNVRLLIILVITSIEKYVHFSHTLCLIQNTLVILLSLRRSSLLTYFPTFLFMHFLLSIPNPLHIYTITIGIILYQWTQNS